MKYTINRSLLTIQDHQCRTTDELFQVLRLSRKTRYELYHSGSLRIGKRIIKSAEALQPEDIVQITLRAEEDSLTPWIVDLSIIYEDDLFLIVNKPAHLLVHSDGINQDHTLCNMVKGYYVCQQIHAPVRPLHRLDLETTGLVIFCKIPLFQPLLDEMLMEKKIQRQYMALVQGRMPQKKMTITQAIARDRHDARKMRISPTGKEARTTVYLEKQYADYALVRCQLHTGRTHQIRVHMASIRHPLLSDELYGEIDHRIDRLALHAYRVKLFHPLLGEEMTIDCPMPKDMQKLL